MSEETTTTAESTVENAPANVGRPGFLTALCILTFIGSGLGVLFMILFTVGMGALMDAIPGLGAITEAGTAYFGVSAFLAAASLYGAIQMWGLKKMGFFIYTGANILMIVLPLAFGLPFSIFGTVIAVLFVVLYFLNFKHMN